MNDNDSDASIDYGKLTKKITFVDNDHRQAKMQVKLQSASLTQSAFFRGVITGLIEGDSRIVSFVEDMSSLSKGRKSKTRKLSEQGKTAVESLGLSEQQMIDIFDMIAEEHPEL